MNTRQSGPSGFQAAFISFHGCVGSAGFSPASFASVANLKVPLIVSDLPTPDEPIVDSRGNSRPDTRRRLYAGLGKPKPFQELFENCRRGCEPKTSGENACGGLTHR
jgi:hypothetical protein